MVFEEQEKLYFHDILSIAMEDAGIGCSALEELMMEKGIHIQFQAISAYARGVQVPSYGRAKALLTELGVQIGENELLDLLQRSGDRIKEQKRYFREDETEIRKNVTIRIKPKNIFPELTAYQGMRILEERIRFLIGDESKFSDYVKMLIKKDLREFILEQNDIQMEEEEKKDGGRESNIGN